ncbi:MAG: hypothetical protein NVV62_15750 [Terricaulis sp.]|nr:hypothetical protein [Terricaulis sp.]
MEEFAGARQLDVHQLIVPDLTLRERLFLQRDVVGKSREELVAGLGFKRAGEIEVADFLENYKRYYRFYPTLLTADV